ncbi:MAG TPA: polysaccharide biosynthesis/export family protein [Pyrinomonadaceae bacterium]|nr:polysaccharide biosynthesis/export family protein [Pyrinomonadaceae bacterium]
MRNLFLINHPRVVRLAKAFVWITLLAASIDLAKARQQQPAIAPPTVQPAAQVETPAARSAATPSAATTDDRYRIGPGDVLEIRVVKSPELSRDAVRVDQRGMIRIPMIADEIQAACRTEIELAKEIATRYLKYKKNPYVDVFVKEFQSQPVAVIGAVNQPGRFQLQRRVRLLELLAFAGGPAERAGRSIQIVHGASNALCETQAAGGAGVDESSALVSYKLSETLSGDEKSNPYVQPGDVITIPVAEQVFVVGNVMRPSAIALKDPITVSQAIAMAGGTMPDTKSNKVRVIRQLPGSTVKTEIFVDLKAIDKRQAEDVVLQANDIVDVPTSEGKRLLRSLLGTIAPTVSQLPVRVVP